MTRIVDDPLARALAALDQIEGPGLDPVAIAALQTAQEALLEAQQEREALLAVARGGRELVGLLDEYQAALEARDRDLIAELGQACGEAEDALAAALIQLRADLLDETELSGDVRHLAALDRVAADNDNEEPPR